MDFVTFVGLVVIAFVLGAVGRFARLRWRERSERGPELTPRRGDPLEPILEAEELGLVFPPKDVRNAVAWDQYWHKMLTGVSSMEIAFGDMMASSPEMIGFFGRRGVKRILCVGNGMSNEPIALALFGFDATALDLSSVPAACFDNLFRGDEFSLRKSPGYTIEDGLIRFRHEDLIDSNNCPPIHRGPEYAPTGGGTVQFLTGDVLDPTVCPGPFDAIIERRTIQLLTPEDQLRALKGLEERLAPRGVLVSHQHSGGWRPHEPRIHFAREWAAERGFVPWVMNSPEETTAPRLTYLWFTTG